MKSTMDIPAACELSTEQADGLSCVACGGDAPTVPVGRCTATGSQVFACAPCCGESS